MQKKIPSNIIETVTEILQPYVETHREMKDEIAFVASSVFILIAPYIKAHRILWSEKTMKNLLYYL